MTTLMLGMIGLPIIIFTLWQRPQLIRQQSSLWPIFLFGLLLWISTLNSDFLRIALFGFPTLYYGALAITSNIIIFWGITVLAHNNQLLRLIIRFIYGASILISLIGIGQSLGYNLLHAKWFQKYLLGLPDHISWVRISPLTSTLNNKNFIGSYACLLIPPSLILFLYQRNFMHKILALFTSTLLLALLIVSDSRGGYVGFAISTLIMFITLLLRERKLIKLLLTVFSLFILLSSALYLHKPAHYKGRVVSTYRNLKKAGQWLWIKWSIPVQKSSSATIELTAYKDVLRWRGPQAGCLKMQVLEKGLKITDCQDSPLPFTIEYDEIFLKNPLYHQYRIKLRRYEGLKGLELKFKTKKIEVVLVNKEFKIHNQGRFYPMPFFTDKELREVPNLLNTRTHIWLKTWPLIKDCLWLGQGPNTFPLYYPQLPFKNMKQSLDYSVRVAKSHSFYLQTIHSSGALSLVLLLFFIASLIVSSFTNYLNSKPNSIFNHLSIGFSIGIIAYMIAGLVNDNVVGIANVFWVFLALIFVFNRKAYRPF